MENLVNDAIFELELDAEYHSEKLSVGITSFALHFLWCFTVRPELEAKPLLWQSGALINRWNCTALAEVSSDILHCTQKSFRSLVLEHT